jgi:hypothetical protein
MTLQQFHALRDWHLRQGRRHPVEKTAWDTVLTVWMLGCVGAPTALLLGSGWAELGCIGAFFLPGTYVAARRWLHRRHRLRCDWMTALR